jgi:predicted kinase
MGAVRVRSDVERKRLADLRPLDKSGSGIGAGLYAESMTRMTYEVLAGHARSILEAGHTAIADATFLKRWQRDLLRQLATDVGVPFAIVDCLADDREIERRLIERAKARKDASEATPAVMGLQRSSADPLAEEEGRRILFDTRRDSAVELARRIAAAVVNQGGP